MEHTKYSYMTEDEIISRVENDPGSTEMERELASRLSDALDELDDAEVELDEVLRSLEAHGFCVEEERALLQ